MGDDPGQTNILSQLLILLLLTGVNGFFAGAEMAMVSTSKSKIKRLVDHGDKRAKMVQDFQKDETKFLSTIQIAITFAGFFSSGSAAASLTEPLGGWLNSAFNVSLVYAEQLAFISVTLLLALFTLIFGELVPKRIALRDPEKSSLSSVRVIKIVSVIFTPIISFLTFSTNLVMKILKMDDEDAEEKVSKEEIKALIRRGQATGTLDNKEVEMINSVIEFNDKVAREVMTPKVNVFSIDSLKPIDNYLPELTEMKYSQVPVYEDDIDNIIGVLRTKDFLKVAVEVGFENVDIKEITKPPYLVPESKNVGELLKEMQVSKIHFTMLIDEFGGFAGIVTLKDLVEEVMGDLEDGHNDPKIQKIDDSTYIVDGLITIDELNDKLDLELSSDNFDTLSGYLIDQIGYIPKEDEDPTIEIENLVFKIENIQHKRLDKVKIYIGHRKKKKKKQ